MHAMKKIPCLLLGCMISLLTFSAHALPPLRVAVDQFNPPFELQSGTQHMYGFDISVVGAVCKQLQRTCEYVPMIFAKLLPAVQNGEVDMAVGSLIITPERAAMVNFSQPYLISNGLFLIRTDIASKPFNLDILQTLKMGAQEGTIYTDVLLSMGVDQSQISTYDTLNNLILALQSKKIDAVVMNEPTALYWQAQASDILKPWGKEFNVGSGLAIVVDKNNIDLLNQVNQALTIYQNSPQFQMDYDRYMAYF